MGVLLETFQNQLLDNFRDTTIRLIFADCLEEQGFPKRAEIQRVWANVLKGEEVLPRWAHVVKMSKEISLTCLSEKSTYDIMLRYVCFNLTTWEALCEMGDKKIEADFEVLKRLCKANHPYSDHEYMLTAYADIDLNTKLLRRLRGCPELDNYCQDLQSLLVIFSRYKKPL